MTEQTFKIRAVLSNGKLGAEREITLAQYRAELDARRPYAKAVMDAFRRNDIAECGKAQRIMREKFSASIVS